MKGSDDFAVDCGRWIIERHSSKGEHPNVYFTVFEEQDLNCRSLQSQCSGGSSDAVTDKEGATWLPQVGDKLQVSLEKYSR